MQINFLIIIVNINNLLHVHISVFQQFLGIFIFFIFNKFEKLLNLLKDKFLKKNNENVRIIKKITLIKLLHIQNYNQKDLSI